MRHHPNSLKCKGKSFEEKQSRRPSRSVYAYMTPPPSYHSFDEMCPHRTSRPVASSSREFHTAPRGQGKSSQHPASDHDQVMINRRPRAERQKHHRRRRSSSSHNRSWAAALIIQGLRSNLFGSGDTGHSGRESGERSVASQKTKLDFSTACREMHNHYTIHNHWQNVGPGKDIPHTETWPAGDLPRNMHDPFAAIRGQGLPPFGLDAQDAAPTSAERPPYHDHPTLLDHLFPAYSTSGPDELSPNFWLKDFLDNFPRHPANDPAFPQSSRETWWNDYREAEQKLAQERQDNMYAWGKHRFNHVNNPETISRTPSGGADPRTHEPGKHPSDQRDNHASRPSNFEDGMPDAASQLLTYNKLWDYTDSVQHPHPRELPWPAIRPNVPFDHMKCDVFSFFARGCGLQPDRSKAPRLDFKLSARSPYPSYDQRQQECERKLLKTFKRQMQREKLRWHEDKLRGKFPEVMGRDEERRKAVWAAIAEGSAVCDGRLAANMP